MFIRLPFYCDIKIFVCVVSFISPKFSVFNLSRVMARAIRELWCIPFPISRYGSCGAWDVTSVLSNFRYKKKEKKIRISILTVHCFVFSLFCILYTLFLLIHLQIIPLNNADDTLSFSIIHIQWRNINIFCYAGCTFLDVVLILPFLAKFQYY